MPSHSDLMSWKSAVDKYLSPKLGMTTTMSLPSYSGSFPRSTAACTAAPEEIPVSRPSSLASLAAMAIAASLLTFFTSSMRLVSKISGTKPAPMPWILCGPGLPPDRTGLSEGSTATTLKPLFWDFRYRAQPVTVPPVPTPDTKASTVPAVSRQISGPVVLTWMSTFAGFSNCCSMNAFSVSFAMSSAFPTAPAMPLAGSVSTTPAPKARSMTLRSMLMEAGMVRISS
mmetsp:Transcript_8454/g.24168  ORF Transcript_8454/g.24168 Transcript_8454/m.24168 type:complete len:228 (-) Transcript_8454:338-1021(-)